MNALWQVPVVILAVLAWLAAPPRSIGEAAEREAFRRKTIPKSRVVLTNLGQKIEIPLVAAATPPPDEPPPVIEPPDPPVVAPPGAPPAAPVAKQDEAWWRARITVARDAVDRDQILAEALQTRINALQRDVVNTDNPILQGKLRQDLQRSLEQLDKANKQIAEGRKAVAAIQEDARRQDVPPGWIR